jgi:K+-sensing histidine kinase KdpD
MGQTKSHQSFQFALRSLLGSGAVLLLTYAGSQLQLDLTAATALCSIVVLFVSLGGSFTAAAVVSVVAFLSLSYFVAPPRFSFHLARVSDGIAVIAILTSGLTIGRLVVRLRRSLSKVQALSEQLQLVVDTIPTLVARTRADGSLEFMNRRWREYLGVPLDEVVDWAWAGALHPEDRERFVEQWRTALSRGEPSRRPA